MVEELLFKKKILEMCQTFIFTKWLGLDNTDVDFFFVEWIMFWILFAHFS